MEIETDCRFQLRLLNEKDAAELLALDMHNRAFFEKTLATRESEYYTLQQHVKMLADLSVKAEQGSAYMFGIFVDGKLNGCISITNIVYGPLCSGMLGYYLDERYNGCGIMSAAVSLVLKFGFEKLKLHRIEAGAMERNAGSVHVLKKNGFIVEGTNRKNVNINHQWEDHLMLAVLKEEWEEQFNV